MRSAACPRPRTILLTLGLAACGTGGGATEPMLEAERGAARIGGQVVATVDGHAITTAEVSSLAQRAALLPREAMKRLEAERLLMAEAERRGYSTDPRALEVRDKALVQALLDREAAAVEVTEEELAEAREVAADRFATPERRESVHVLVRVPEGAPADRDAAAKTLAEQLRRELAGVKDADALRAAVLAYRGEKRDGFDLVGEALPPVDPEAPFAKPFLKALFEARQPGLLPGVTRTSFGYHVIVLVRVEPAKSTPDAEVRRTLTAELLERKRRQRVETLLRELRAASGVEQVPEAGERVASFELF